MTIEHNAFAEALAQALLQTVAQRSKLLRRLWQRSAGDLGRLSESDDVRHILRPGPPPALVPGAVDQAFEFHPAANEQRPRSFRCIYLMPRDGEQIDAEFLHIDFNFS